MPTMQAIIQSSATRGRRQDIRAGRGHWKTDGASGTVGCRRARRRAEGARAVQRTFLAKCLDGASAIGCSAGVVPDVRQVLDDVAEAPQEYALTCGSASGEEQHP